MKLADLSTWDGYSPLIYSGLITSTLSKDIAAKQSTSYLERVAAFRKNWLAGTATLPDWMSVPDVNLEAILQEAALDSINILKLRERQKRLYALRIEARLQYQMLYSFKDVLEVTPDQIQNYAQLQLQLLGDLLHSGLQPEWDKPHRLLPINYDIDYEALYREVQSGRLERNYDIHNDEVILCLDEALRYKSFLETFLSDPLLEENATTEGESFTFQNLFPRTIAALERIVADIYHFTEELYEEEGGGFVTFYHVVQVNGFKTADQFRVHLKSIFREEYRVLLQLLRQYDLITQEALLTKLSEEITTFLHKSILLESNLRRLPHPAEGQETYTFKRLPKVGFNNLPDMELAFKKEKSWLYKNLLEKVEPFALAAEEALHSFIRKMEDTAHYLDILDFSMEVAAESTHDALSFEYKKMDTAADNITAFYNALKDASYIEKSTSLPAFRNVFMGRKVLHPVIWTGNTGELNHLIKTLHNKQRKLKPAGRKLWEMVAHCFIRPGGIRFDRDKLRKAKVPADASRLDRICNNL
jgi:hypothetical protein